MRKNIYIRKLLARANTFCKPIARKSFTYKKHRGETCKYYFVCKKCKLWIEKWIIWNKMIKRFHNLSSFKFRDLQAQLGELNCRPRWQDGTTSNLHSLCTWTKNFHHPNRRRDTQHQPNQETLINQGSLCLQATSKENFVFITRKDTPLTLLKIIQVKWQAAFCVRGRGMREWNVSPHSHPGSMYFIHREFVVA